MPALSRPILAGLLAVAIAVLPARAAEAAEEAAALARAERLVNGAHAAMTAEDLSEEARHDRLRGVIAEAFAFDIWERFLVGERRDAFTEAQLAEFRGLLPGFLADLYTKQFGRGLEAKPEIKGARPARRDILVSADIPRANGKNLPVKWRVREFEERGHLVIDVMVGGVSFLVLKREEFGAIMERSGPVGLLAYMRENAL